MGSESGSEGSDFADMISDISEKNKSGLESDSEFTNHLPTWAKKTLSSAGQNIGNPVDPRRTRSEFKRAGIVLSCNDDLVSKNYYLIFF